MPWLKSFRLELQNCRRYTVRNFAEKLVAYLQNALLTHITSYTPL